MRKLYKCPVAEVVEFDGKDVITTSGELKFPDDFTEGLFDEVNKEEGWSELY